MFCIHCSEEILQASNTKPYKIEIGRIRFLVSAGEDQGSWKDHCNIGAVDFCSACNWDEDFFPDSRKISAVLTWAQEQKVFYVSLIQNTTVAKVTETVICSVRKPMDLLIY